MKNFSLVFEGHQIGRTIGYPTLNLDPQSVGDISRDEKKHGVYSAKVWIADREYIGAAYVGPRAVFGETKTVFEIFVVDFDREIYGQEVAFQLFSFIRGVLELNSLAELQAQLNQDVLNVKKSLENTQ